MGKQARQSLDLLDPIENDIYRYIRRYLELDKKYKEDREKQNNETKKMLLNFLEVLDAFDQVMGSITVNAHELSAEKTTWIKKVDKVHKKFKRAFKNCNVEQVKAKNGARVNSSLHTVVKEVKKKELKDGIITGIIRKGYLLNGKLLRAADVKAVNNRKKGGAE